MPLMRAPTNPFTGEPESASALEGEVQGLANPVAAPAFAVVNTGRGMAELIQSLASRHPMFAKILDKLDRVHSTTNIRFGDPVEGAMGHAEMLRGGRSANTPLQRHNYEQLRDQAQRGLELIDDTSPLHSQLQRDANKYNYWLQAPDFNIHDPSSAIDVIVNRNLPKQFHDVTIAHEVGGHASEPLYPIDALLRAIKEVQGKMPTQDLATLRRIHTPGEFEPELWARGLTDSIFGRRVPGAGTNLQPYRDLGLGAP